MTPVVMFAAPENEKGRLAPERESFKGRETTTWLSRGSATEQQFRYLRILPLSCTPLCLAGQASLRWLDLHGTRGACSCAASQLI
jgi:hypothetical protein